MLLLALLMLPRGQFLLPNRLHLLPKGLLLLAPAGPGHTAAYLPAKGVMAKLTLLTRLQGHCW